MRQDDGGWICCAHWDGASLAERLGGGFKSELQHRSFSTDLNVLCDETFSSLNVLQLSAFDVQRRAFTFGGFGACATDRFRATSSRQRTSLMGRLLSVMSPPGIHGLGLTAGIKAPVTSRTQEPVSK